MITNTADFVATLALYSQRRDEALGFNHPSRRTLGLSWYYQKVISREAKEAVINGYWTGVLLGVEERMAEIMALAPNVDTDTKRQLVEEARKLRALAEKAAGVLSG